MPDQPLDPHNDLRKKFREVMKNPQMLWGIEVEPYDLLERDTRLPLASINLANEEGLIEEAFGRFRLTIKGYDDDPRQPFDIPEVRGWFAQLHQDAPFFPYFLEPELILVYAASLLEHSYSDGALRLNPSEVEDFVQRTKGAIMSFCLSAKVDPTEAIEVLSDLFQPRPRVSLPEEEFALPSRGLLFAFDLEEAERLYGENFWKRLDSACLRALQTLSTHNASAEVTLWGHLGEGFFGVFLVGADADLSERFTRSLSSRFTGAVLSEPEELTPTTQALPFWALKKGRLMRCADEDPEEGPAILVVSFDGEEWAFEAYEPNDEMLEEVLELTPGIEMVVARVTPS